MSGPYQKHSSLEGNVIRLGGKLCWDEEKELLLIQKSLKIISPKKSETEEAASILFFLTRPPFGCHDTKLNNILHNDSQPIIKTGQ